MLGLLTATVRADIIAETIAVAECKCAALELEARWVIVER